MARPGHRRQEEGGSSDLHTSDSVDRPQVLAQLAKDISNLIRSARAAPQEAEPLGSIRRDAPAAAPATDSRVEARALGSVFSNTGAAAAPAKEEDASLMAAEPPSLLEAASVRAPSMQNDNTQQGQPSQPLPAGFSRRGETIRVRSPQEVHTLLASIESREAGLHRKVQQLTEEKCLREEHLEEQVRRLQKSNARLEEELQQAARQASDDPPDEASSRRDDGAELCMTQDVWEDLQWQIQEIRDEVTRCARTLKAPEELAHSEILDIRQQLQALSSEVYQTSLALQGRVGTFGNNGSGAACNSSALSDVGQQLEALQSHVSSALSFAMAQPTEPIGASHEARLGSTLRESLRQLARPNDRGEELAKLRAEVNSLRSQLAQDRRQGVSPEHTGQDIRGQLQEQMEALRSDLGRIAQAPLASVNAPASLAPEVAALHGRLTAIRAEVARVLHDSQHFEDMASPARQAHLGALLSELCDVRTSAASLAGSGGLANPCMPPAPATPPLWQLQQQQLQQQYLQQHYYYQQQATLPAAAYHQQLTPLSAAAGPSNVGLHETHAAAAYHQLPSQLAATAAPGSTGLHFTGGSDLQQSYFQRPSLVEPQMAGTPTVNELPGPERHGDQRVSDMLIGRTDWSSRPSRDNLHNGSRTGQAASPLLVCQHVATDLGFGPSTYGSFNGNVRGSGNYVASSDDATARLGGNGHVIGGYTYHGPDATTQHLGSSFRPSPSLQGAAAGSRPSSARSGGGCSSESHQIHSSLSFFEPQAGGTWLPPESHRRPTLAESQPPEEPSDRAPQGLMRRPSRSQLLAS